MITKEQAEKELAKLSPEERETLEAKTKMLMDNIIILMRIGAPRELDLTEHSVLGKFAQEYCKKFGCSVVECAGDVKQIVKYYREQVLNFSPEINRKKPRPKKSYKTNKPLSRYEQNIKDSGGGTLGDMMKAKGITLK